MISVCFASRGRPESLRASIASLVDLAERPDEIEIIVGLDEDDEETLCSELHPAAKYLISPRPLTVHHVVNTCADAARGEFLSAWGDDYLCQTRGWDVKIDRRGTLERVMYWDDPSHPGFPSLYVVPRYMLEHWQFASDIYPYWFADTCWAEIGMALGGIERLPCKAVPSGPRVTQNIRDVAFWRDIFILQRIERIEAAMAIAGADINRWIRPLFDADLIASLESRQAPETDRYLKAKARAIDKYHTQ